MSAVNHNETTRELVHMRVDHGTTTADLCLTETWGFTRRGGYSTRQLDVYQNDMILFSILPGGTLTTYEGWGTVTLKLVQMAKSYWKEVKDRDFS